MKRSSQIPPGFVALFFLSVSLIAQANDKGPKLDPDVKWTKPADISYGTPLGSDQLNATASVAGTFVYSPAAGTILGVGQNQTLSTTFTPNNTILYKPVTKSVKINVGPATLTCSVSNVNKIYGAGNPEFIIAYTGFVNGESVGNLDTTPVVSCQADATSGAGYSFPIVVTGGSDPNYAFQYQNGLLTVTQATVVAKADDQTRKYGLGNPSLSISYTGFVNGESATVLDVLPVAATTATLNSPAGTYAITVGSGSDNNYNFTYVPGKLIITGGGAIHLTDFQIITAEDSKFTFDLRPFQQNFSSYPGDSIAAIKIVTLPRHGTLLWKTNKVLAGDQITVSNGKLQDFTYTPIENFNGGDTLVWNATDGTATAPANAFVTAYIIPVNDAPVINDSDMSPIPYKSGDPAVHIAGKMTLKDVDNMFITSATVTITQNHLDGDLIAMEGFTSPNLTPSFDAHTGVFRIEGNDLIANYEAALQHLVFSSPVSTESTKFEKSLKFSVDDASSTSNELFKTMEVTDFPNISIVNAFTPNHDGVDDYWDFVNLQFYPKIKIAVFDQNGTQVFDCGGPDCKWDGKLNGRELPAGPYFYSIQIADLDKKYNGVVTILKP